MEYIIRENALTDNTLHIAPKGKVFRGGYIAVLEEYTFQNAWQDKKEIKRFRSFDSLQKYLAKHYTEEELEFVELSQL